jgi:quercetin dioxygenase-like cupin family protein
MEARSVRTDALAENRIVDWTIVPQSFHDDGAIMNDTPTATRLQTEAQTPYARRARYHIAENGFAFQFPAVPIHKFLQERDVAFDAATPTGLVALDTSAILKTAYPATTPTILCRYVKIRAGERLSTTFVASGEIFYVMSGGGESRNGSDVIAWTAGDVFCFPGGDETTHRAGERDSLLFCVTNEPLLAFERLRAPTPGNAMIDTTHWPATEIDSRFEAVWRRPMTPDTTGYSVQFTSEALAPSINTIPSINCSINTLAAGADQRPHRHNGVAITLAIEGEGIHSTIDGQRVDWSTGAAQITPATLMHSHHARGDKRMRSFVIQDEGLHFYTRTPGFSFD